MVGVFHAFESKVVYSVSDQVTINIPLPYLTYEGEVILLWYINLVLRTSGKVMPGFLNIIHHRIANICDWLCMSQLSWWHQQEGVNFAIQLIMLGEYDELTQKIRGSTKKIFFPNNNWYFSINRDPHKNVFVLWLWCL